MFRWLTGVTVLIAALGTVAAMQERDGDVGALRERLERRYGVVALTDGVALRPKARTGDVRLIEVTQGAVLVNGTAVTGRELRDRLGNDADPVLRLSYLSGDALRMFAAAREAEPQAPERPDAAPPLEAPAPPRAEAPRVEPERDGARPPDGRTWSRRSSGDRIRIFGDVSVDRDEEISGQAVAVFGDVRVHGKVNDQVVAVLGSVMLGPDAVVGGDVVSVGGRVFRDGRAETRRGVTEVGIDRLPFEVHVGPWGSWHDLPWLGSFGAIPRLFATTMRLSLLLVVTAIVLIVARRSVEASAERVIENPLKVAAVGLLAELLTVPVLILAAIVLSVSLIGIPLLLLLPFVVLALIVMALIGFTGTAAAVGSFVQRRVPGTAPDYLTVLLGVLVILSPLLIARLVAIGGWPLAPVSMALLGLAFVVELLAWATGFGAMLLNAFTRWEARRAGRVLPSA